MKYYILLTTVLVSCGGVRQWPCYSRGVRCHAEEPAPTCTVVNATITCPDGTSANLPPGLAGSNGVDGAVGETGAKGDTGETGKQGPQGVKGDKGDAGVQGTPGLDAVVTVYTPCLDGDNQATVSYPEIVLKMRDGKLFAVYSATPAYLTEVTPGQYITSDGGNCRFDVNADNGYVAY